MNSQDNAINTLLDNIATPDKPESPIIHGTGSLEDDFTISEAGENPVLPADNEASVENPLLFNAQDSGSKKIDSADLDRCLKTELIDELFDWDFDSISPTIIYHDKEVTNSIKSISLSLLVLLIPIIISILLCIHIQPLFEGPVDLAGYIFVIAGYIPIIFFLVVFMIFIFREIIRSILDILYTKADYNLKIIIHNDEILLEEISKAASQIYAFPRNSKDLQIEFTPLKSRLVKLGYVSIKSLGSHFFPDRAFENENALKLISLVRKICSDHQLAASPSPPAPYHLETSARHPVNDSNEDYFL